MNFQRADNFPSQKKRKEIALSILQNWKDKLNGNTARICSQMEELFFFINPIIFSDYKRSQQFPKQNNSDEIIKNSIENIFNFLQNIENKITCLKV